MILGYEMNLGFESRIFTDIMPKKTGENFCFLKYFVYLHSPKQKFSTAKTEIPI
jgi:hypothetical protein